MSAALEVRRALVEESLHAFVGVGAAAGPEDAFRVGHVRVLRIGLAEAVRDAFPDRAAWLSIDAPPAELRWADGVHLDERSALIVARAIEKALAGAKAR